ncbi:MAG: serine/threonine protein kinase [Deltaproteobacteria bacterium]|nr:MAG: serine/threonine protein kinase [Deltaproteobacteria bacterium]
MVEGSAMAERFKLITLLGRPGGFAHTWKAEVLDPALQAQWGSIVALKIPLSREKEEVLVEELIKNAVLQANLKRVMDSHIVRYLGFSKYRDQFVMIMECVEGQDLRQRIGEVGKGNPLPVAEALEIAVQVCRGLVTIHRFGIFHRDIKPENVLIPEGNGPVKIADLGISRMLEPAELASTTTGTIYYMPKEVLRGQGGNFISDTYSLGVTLYEMLTGRVPFMGKSITEIIDNICQGRFIPPKDLNPHMEDKLNAIVLKAMARELKGRYGSALEFLQAMERYRGGNGGSNQALEVRLAAIHQSLGAGAQDKALALSERLLEDFPDSERAYLLVGDAFCRWLRPQPAATYLRIGVERFPRSASLHRMLAVCLYNLDQAKRGPTFKEALEVLRQALRLAPDQEFEEKVRILLAAWERSRPGR